MNVLVRVSAIRIVCFVLAIGVGSGVLRGQQVSPVTIGIPSPLVPGTHWGFSERLCLNGEDLLVGNQAWHYEEVWLSCSFSG